MTRISATTTLLTLLAFAAILSAQAAAATISFVPSAAEVSCDATVDIDVLVDGVPDLRGFTMEVEFDPTLLAVVSVTSGPDLAGAPCPSFFHVFPMTTTISAVAFDGAPLGCSIAGPARIATLTFEGIQEGISLLDCRRAELRNSLNLMIASTCAPAAVQISCPVATNDQSWSALKAIYR